ncbi:DUF1513 domain-containing protein [Psychromonas hadalis]|uniref:DUF1513 domain-containing protein n=1 Tax=Psychromonas hadalis TaxID=211669 RepID=UPI0003B32B80|nr:DUF1513 domain-containing protein [Psychromonas hadalis]
MLRRDFLRFSAQLSLAGLFPSASVATTSTMTNSAPILYACAKQQQQFFLVGSDLQGNTLSQFVLPTRGHGIAIDNIHQQAVVFARRPDNYLIQFDPATGKTINHYQIEAGKYFYGHGCFDQQGLLYVCEGESDSSQTSIGIYQLGDEITKIGEFNGLGLGAHEIVMHPNNQHLILALGGIKTRGRKKTNLDTMQPALLYIDKTSGQVKQTITLENQQLSIRHLSVNKKGLVVFACQYQGLDELLPLVYQHQFGDQQASPLMGAEEQWLRFDDYIGSIAINEQQIIATSPRGNCYATWHISNKKLQKIQSLNDVCGAVYYHQKRVLSTGNGELGRVHNMQQTQWHWDNHMAIWLG